MKFTTAIAAATMAIASPATAETFNLSYHNYWTTTLSVDEDNDFAYCAIENINDQMMFRINVTDEGNYWIFINDYATRDVQANGTIAMKLDFLGRDPITWTMNNTKIDADGSGVVISFSFGNERHRRDFFSDFMINDRIQLLDEGRPVATWSLQGSSNAIRALDECRQRIVRGQL